MTVDQAVELSRAAVLLTLMIGAPVLIMALTSETVAPGVIYAAADSIVAPRIAQVPGTATVSLAGAEQPAIRVSVDPAAATAVLGTLIAADSAKVARFFHLAIAFAACASTPELSDGASDGSASVSIAPAAADASGFLLAALRLPC